MFDRGAVWLVPPALVLAAATVAMADGRQPPPVPSQAAKVARATRTAPALTDSAKLGERIFFDRTLSRSGKMACADCHDPRHAHAQPNGLAAQRGGPAGEASGFRAVPSLRYLAFAPDFFVTREGRPHGGYNRDGSIHTLEEQARKPLLAAHEMANGDSTAVVRRLKHAPYAQTFRNVFGADIFDDTERAFGRLTFALQQYQQQAAAFQPFDSRYDRFLAGEASLSAAERRGLALFEDPAKGNCVACHPSRPSDNGVPPLFTDFGFANLGVPRNAALPSTADARYFDLGTCGTGARYVRLGSGRTPTNPAPCGAFKTPMLRNVASRKIFFHNGAVDNLRDAVRFHVRRDTHPAEWYPRDAAGRPRKFDDVPTRHHGHVEKTRAPFDRRPGMAPALSEPEIADVMAFLATLTDADVAGMNN